MLTEQLEFTTSALEDFLLSKIASETGIKPCLFGHLHWQVGYLPLSDFTFTFHFHALEKEMATQSSILAWRIPGTGEPGGLLSMGLHRVGHD